MSFAEKKITIFISENKLRGVLAQALSNILDENTKIKPYTIMPMPMGFI